jgi:hypothetical protein
LTGTVEDKGRGIAMVRTAKGIDLYLPPALNALMSATYRSEDGWYAGDVPLAAVAMACPELFPMKDRRAAPRILAVAGAKRRAA